MIRRQEDNAMNVPKEMQRWKRLWGKEIDWRPDKKDRGKGVTDFLRGEKGHKR
jgi:hypothetical protein